MVPDKMPLGMLKAANWESVAAASEEIGKRRLGSQIGWFPDWIYTAGVRMARMGIPNPTINITLVEMEVARRKEHRAGNPNPIATIFDEQLAKMLT